MQAHGQRTIQTAFATGETEILIYGQQTLLHQSATLVEGRIVVATEQMKGRLPRRSAQIFSRQGIGQYFGGGIFGDQQWQEGIGNQS